MASIPKDFEYNEWLSKTNFSFLMGGSHPHEMVQSAHQFDYQSLCINDFDGQYGLARTFLDKQRLAKTQKVSLKLNYGFEVRLEDRHNSPVLSQKTVALVAQNWNGYKNLNTLASLAQTKGKRQARLSVPEILDLPLQDTFAIIPMRDCSWNKSDLCNFQKLKDALRGELYFALTKTYSRYSDRHIPGTLALSQKLESSVIFSQDAFYHHAHQKSFHDLLSAIRANQAIKLSGAHFFSNGERSLHAKAWLWQTYKNFPNFQNMQNLMRDLNEKCQFSLAEIRYEYPKEMIPDRHTSQSYLEELTWESVGLCYKNDVPEKLTLSINKELNLIKLSLIHI